MKITRRNMLKLGVFAFAAPAHALESAAEVGAARIVSPMPAGLTTIQLPYFDRLLMALLTKPKWVMVNQQDHDGLIKRLVELPGRTVVTMGCPEPPVKAKLLNINGVDVRVGSSVPPGVVLCVYEEPSRFGVVQVDCGQANPFNTKTEAVVFQPTEGA